MWQDQNVIGFGSVILQKGTKVFSNLFNFVLLNKLQYKNESNKDLIYNIKKKKKYHKFHFLSIPLCLEPKGSQLHVYQLDSCVVRSGFCGVGGG